MGGAMRRILIIAAIALAFAAGPAGALPERTPTPQAAPPAAEAELRARAAMQELGAWSQEYNGILTRLLATMRRMEDATQILEQYTAGALTRAKALRDLDAWSAAAQAEFAAIYAAAAALREPPNFAEIEPSAAAVDELVRIARTELPANIASVEEFLKTIAVLYREAIDSPERSAQARERAVYEAALRIAEVENRSYRLGIAVIPQGHPSRYIAGSMVLVNNAVIAYAHFHRDSLENSGDTAALAASLRSIAAGLRAECDAGDQATHNTTRTLRAAQAQETAGLATMVLAIMRTMPPSFVALREVATAIDTSADRIERGDDPSDVWADEDETVMPHLEALSRLDMERAAIAARGW